MTRPLPIALGCSLALLLGLLTGAAQAQPAPPPGPSGMVTAAEAKRYLEELVDPANAIDPDKLIAQLGAADFREREAATERLISDGFAAADQLRAATQSSDPEVAARASAILSAMRTGSGHTRLMATLKSIETQKLAVGLPLLLKVRAKVPVPEVQAACDVAMAAIIGEADRALAAKLLKDDHLELRNLARRLLARLEPTDLPPLLEGTFDAVQVKVGNVSGGGANLIAGWEFTAKADLSVTHLGVLDIGEDGLHQAHEVAIWNLADDKAPVAALTVPAGVEAPLAGVFRLAPLEEPARLSAGKRYAVVALYPEDGELDMTVSRINPRGLTVAFMPHLEVAGRRYAFPHKKMAFPDKLDAGIDRATLGPTFRYEAAP